MDVSTIQGQIAAIAKRYPDRGLTSLNKYLDEDWLRAAFKRLRKDGATGVDSVSVREYGEELDERLTDLVNRAKSGSYHAPAVRRTYIEKPGKREKRPLGIPTTEDKLLQKAVVMLLEPIYENEFYDFYSKPRATTGKASGSSEILVLSRETLHELLNKNSAMAISLNLGLGSLLARRLGMANKTLRLLTYEKLREKRRFQDCSAKCENPFV